MVELFVPAVGLVVFFPDFVCAVDDLFFGGRGHSRPILQGTERALDVELPGNFEAPTGKPLSELSVPDGALKNG
jgi:hypothetical protein